MSLLRIAMLAAIMTSAIGCGGTYSPTPAEPSPTPAPAPSPAPAPAPGGSSSSVTIPMGAQSLGNRAYMPAELSVAPGTTVTWMNTDAIPHTSTSDATGWDSGIVGPGAQFSRRFETAGTFPYHCALHPGMVATVVVR